MKKKPFTGKLFRRSLSATATLALLGGAFAGCGAEPSPTSPAVPSDYQWASYRSEEDAPFLPKDIFSEELRVPGIVAGPMGSGFLEMTDRQDVSAIVLKGEYGKCYEVKIPKEAGRVCAGKTTYDPSRMDVGNRVTLLADHMLVDTNAQTEDVSFMYTCRTSNEYLIICADSAVPVYIGERTILQETDIQDPWYIPQTVGSIGDDCTWGDHLWTSEQVLNNLYEPVRQCYPEYITRTHIGKDQTGKYDMYGYVYAPENYEITMFLTSGTHASEPTAYFALAKVMQLIADAQPEDTLLYTLRHKVRFVVIPLINVWSISNTHVRQNATGTDLNRDFGELTQQESKNVIAWFEQYAKEAKILMDFHISTSKDVSVYFNFINDSENSVANYKTTNHMYHRYMELGYAVEQTDMSKVPGSYTKSDKYLEGRIWNSYGVPTITVEYMTNERFPQAYTSEAMTLAVETQMNFIIQNGLYFLANP